MSLLAPIGDARYAQLRPNLKLTPSGNSADVFAEDSRLHWHPSAAPLRDLHIAGKVSVMPAIGYGDPNQSHFTSRHYWEVGEVNPFGRIGWLGRYLDKHGAGDNPLQGLSLDYSLAPALAASNVPVAAVSNPEYFSLDARDVWDSGLRTKLIDALRVQGTLATDDAELRSARNAAKQTVGLRGQLAGLQGTDAPWQTAVPYPSEDGFARRLAVLAEMLDMGLPLKVVALDANGGYDTHDNQAGTLPNDLALFSQSLAAFQADLEARGLADRVLVNVWSEFGRRPERERQRHRPRRGRRSRWSSAPRRRARWSASSRASPSSTRTTTSATRPTSAPSTARCSSSGWTSTPPGSSPTPRRSSDRCWWGDPQARTRRAAGGGARPRQPPTPASRGRTPPSRSRR